MYAVKRNSKRDFVLKEITEFALGWDLFARDLFAGLRQTLALPPAWKDFTFYRSLEFICYRIKYLQDSWQWMSVPNLDSIRNACEVLFYQLQLWMSYVIGRVHFPRQKYKFKLQYLM